MIKGILWLVLTEESKKQLFDIVTPLYPVIYAHHITLFYDISLTVEMENLLGSTHSIFLKENAYNSKIQAVTVTLDGLSCQNQFPHITISALPAIPPVESNTMLQEPHSSFLIEENMQLEGVVQFKEFDS